MGQGRTFPFERHFVSTDFARDRRNQFVCRLRQRAATCDFGADEDDYIRDQFIDTATPGRSQRPDYSFSVEQLSDCKELGCALVTLVIDGVSVPDVLIDLGASCNIVGQ